MQAWEDVLTRICEGGNFNVTCTTADEPLEDPLPSPAPVTETEESEEWPWLVTPYCITEEQLSDIQSQTEALVFEVARLESSDKPSPLRVNEQKTEEEWWWVHPVCVDACHMEMDEMFLSEMSNENRNTQNTSASIRDFETHAMFGEIWRRVEVWSDEKWAELENVVSKVFPPHPAVIQGFVLYNFVADVGYDLHRA